MSDTDEIIYAGALPGWPGYCAVMVDNPRFKKDTAREMATWIKSGYIVSRVTRHEGVEGMREFLAEKKRRAEAPAAVQTDLPLFSGAA